MVSSRVNWLKMADLREDHLHAVYPNCHIKNPKKKKYPKNQQQILHKTLKNTKNNKKKLTKTRILNKSTIAPRKPAKKIIKKLSYNNQRAFYVK
jgi:hypothetical protein